MPLSPLALGGSVFGAGGWDGPGRTDLLAAVEQHQIGPLMYEAAGQSVHWLRGIEPVAAVMDRLVTETRQALQSMASYIA